MVPGAECWVPGAQRCLARGMGIAKRLKKARTHPARENAASKDLGEHPSEGGKIEVLSGKYGPYITHNKVNANVPRGKDPAAVTVDEAVIILAERIAKAGEGGGKSRFGKGKAKAAKPKVEAANDDAAPKKKSPPKRKSAPKKDAAE